MDSVKLLKFTLIGNGDIDFEIELKGNFRNLGLYLQKYKIMIEKKTYNT